MYYFLYAFLYLFSLLPFTILYFLSDAVSYLLQFVFKYRKEVIYSNLKNAFPQKQEAEITILIKEFYRNFTDSMVETIKLLTLSKKGILKRAKMDFSEVNATALTGRNIQFYSGHLFGWEYLSLIIAESMKIPFVGIYMKINNTAVERLFIKIRSRTKAVLISTAEMPKKFPQMDLKQYSIGFIADQNPPNEKSAYWMQLFHRPAPFLTGPEKFAERNNTVVYFLYTKKVKRGYYEFGAKQITDDASKFEKGELTRKYRDYLETEISRDPANYLWSHRRWKTPWNIAYKRKWIDESIVPN